MEGEKMKSVLNNKKVSIIAKSSWIDELSEEEEEVLRHSAKIDNAMKLGEPIKIGILK